MTQKQTLSIILDIFIVICAAFCMCFLFFFIEPDVLPRQILVPVIFLPVLTLVVYETICWSRPTKLKKIRKPSISTLMLLGEDDRPIRIWDLTGKVGLLIGKSSADYQVDIDLSDTDYHTYVDPEHAILNYQESGWWIQDTSSRNGISIFRRGKELKPGHHAPVRLELGDVICVAHYTRIAVN
jgi:hypothetical protein